jgi:hypothetical protein
MKLMHTYVAKRSCANNCLSLMNMKRMRLMSSISAGLLASALGFTQAQAQTITVYWNPSTAQLVPPFPAQLPIYNFGPISGYYFHAGGVFTSVSFYDTQGGFWGTWPVNDVFATAMSGGSPQVYGLSTNARNSSNGTTGGAITTLAYDTGMGVLYMRGTFTAAGGNSSMRSFGIFKLTSPGGGWIQNYTLQSNGITAMHPSGATLAFTGTYNYVQTGNWDFPRNNSLAGRYFNPAGQGLAWNVYSGYPITYAGYFTGGSGTEGPVEELSPEAMDLLVRELLGPPSEDVAPSSGAALLVAGPFEP